MVLKSKSTLKGISMIKRALISLLLIGLTVSGALAANMTAKKAFAPFISKTTKTSKDAKKITSQMFNLEPFEEISINGPINVEIIANTELHDIRIIGTKNYVDNVKVDAYKNELRVNLMPPPDETGRTMVVIRTGRLSQLNLVGRGTVKAIGVDTDKLIVNSEYSGMIDISGPHVGLESLRAEGPGVIRFHGLNTSSLKVKANANNIVKLSNIKRLARFDYSGNGTIELKPFNSHYLHVTGRGKAMLITRGQVDTLELTLHGAAIFDGRDLKVHTAYANTYNVAQAHIYVLKTQHSLAADNSDILFYNNAHFIGRHMLASGAVLNYGRIETQPEM